MSSSDNTDFSSADRHPSRGGSESRRVEWIPVFPADVNHGSNWFLFEFEERCKNLRLRVLRDRLSWDDVDSFADKIKHCVRLMTSRAPLSEWEFRVDLSEVVCMDRAFLVALTNNLKDLMDSGVQTFCHSVGESSQLFELMKTNRLLDDFTRSVEDDFRVKGSR